MSTHLYVQRPQDQDPAGNPSGTATAMQIQPPADPGFWLVDSARDYVNAQAPTLPKGTVCRIEVVLD